jgi:hypothetical protein
MKINLVFSDWLKNNKSVYNTNSELSYGDFHSGTVFKAEIKLDEQQQEELQEYLKQGFVPVFELNEEL